MVVPDSSEESLYGLDRSANGCVGGGQLALSESVVMTRSTNSSTDNYLAAGTPVSGMGG